MIPSQAAFAQDNCGICLISVATGQGQAIFTAQCSHSFHYPCIVNNVQHGNLCCPICGAKWDEDTVPFQVPLPQQPHPFPPTQNPFQRQPHWTFHTSPFQQQPQAPQEPPSYSDDEPLQTTSQTQSYGHQNVTIRTHTESSAISAAESRPQFPVLVSIRAPPLQDSDGIGRTPIDLVTVLDVSGSMAGLKLDLVKRAVKFVIQNLGASDRLSIVTFSTTARSVFPLRRMSVEGRESAIRAVDSLKSEDMTDIVAGLEIGARILEGRRERNPVASIMLLSDGMHNCGGQIVGKFSRKLAES